MRIKNLSLPRFAVVAFFFFAISLPAWTQTSPTPSRIVEQVNESALLTLRGNTHPLAQPQFDQGAASPGLSMDRMLLVLKRSDAQEAALQALLDAEQDPTSPSYHQWLTPDQFGQQFGPSDQDLQTVAVWLQSHGFQVTRVSKGRTVIEFSGSAAQVLDAFHTQIHKYTVNGQDHWANASDPQIPQALAPVIVGINSLHNFLKTPEHHVAGIFSKSRVTGKVSAIKPEFTIPGSNDCPGAGYCYFVGPYDFATIYNVLPLWNASSPIDGTGQSIAIIGRSDIVLQDVQDFRNLFGLPANDPNFIIDGTDPGLVPGDETEAALDVEWSGAVAKGAKINLVISASTETTDGVDLSALYAVENDVAPVISESFSQCELVLGTAGNSFENGIREQAAAEGITFLTSTGDQGSAGCDYYMGNVPEPAVNGLAVSGLASSPYGVAVGGTDFLNFGPSYTLSSLEAPSPYWSLTNTPQQASALGYVPESTWNSSCANNIFVVLKYGATPEASCNNSQAENWVETIAGSGGKSSCIASNGTTAPSCLGGYPKPAWQSAPGVPADQARDIPDVSLFASSGFNGSAYIICEADQPSPHGSCSLSEANYTFLGVGGTSVASPAFAGIMAMVNQYTQSAGQGNANPVLYKLASSSAQTSSNCNSSAIPASACIFYDVTTGTIEVPCTNVSPNCTFTKTSDFYGVLSGYNAGSGYDLATGLGSVNAYNLVENWIQPSATTSTTLMLNGGNPVNITHGQNVSFNIAVTPAAAPGVVSLVGSPVGSSFTPLASFPLQNGTASGSTDSLAGGTSYTVKAHYPGNGTYAPSDSPSVTVTVAPEPSKTLISLPVYAPNSGMETGNTPASVPYGTLVGVRVDVGNAAAQITFPPQVVCAQFACPTGTVTVTDSANGSPGMPIPGSSAFELNLDGFSENDGVLFTGGTHQLSASYPGNNSYTKSLGGYTLAVTPAVTQVNVPYLNGTVLTGTQYSISALVTSSTTSGAAPTGTITFYDGTNPIQGTVTLQPQGPFLSGVIVYSFTTSGQHSITAKYGGDSNYVASTSAPMVTSVFYPTTGNETANPAMINLGQSVTLTATATSSSKTPPMTGTFSFYGNISLGGPIMPTLSTDANGNQVLTATITIAPQNNVQIQSSYSGDSNYEGSGGNVLIQVNIPDFSIATTSSNLTITAGQTGSTTATFTPLSEVSSTVMVTCFPIQSISGITCSVLPSSTVNLINGANATTTISIATLPPSSGSSTSQFVPVRIRGKRQIPPPGQLGLAIADCLAIIFMSLWSGRKRYRLLKSLGVVCLLAIVLGCGTGGAGGTGGGGGGTGGGGNNLEPTTLTLSTSSLKVASGAPVTFTATVNSTVPATGTVSFLDSASIDTGGAFQTVVVSKGSAQTTVSYLSIGTHIITAQYSGDTKNEASQTNGSISQVITGTTEFFVNGATSSLIRNTALNVTIQ